uniref:Uncharacterized protein n=1 Tax=viral metagenome TaxID=1070528 RepID=A0A6M3JA67_9ZZZZ
MTRNIDKFIEAAADEIAEHFAESIQEPVTVDALAAFARGSIRRAIDDSGVLVNREPVAHTIKMGVTYPERAFEAFVQKAAIALDNANHHSKDRFISATEVWSRARELAEEGVRWGYVDPPAQTDNHSKERPK